MSASPSPRFNPSNPATWALIGGIIIVGAIGAVTQLNGFGGSGATNPSTASSSPTTAGAPTSATSFPESGACNPGDVKLTVHLYGRTDIGMTYTVAGTTGDQTSWPAGNAPFPNSFPKYPAPWLRYGCFPKLATVHLTFKDASEPWTAFSRTSGGVCALSRPLTKGRTYSPAELSAPLSCDIGLQVDTELSAYWAEPSFVNGALADFAEFPGCLPNGTPGYCPPAGGN
jgi:hypothetical protein